MLIFEVNGRRVMRFSLTSLVVVLILVPVGISEPRVGQGNGSDINQQPILGRIAWQYDTGG